MNFSSPRAERGHLLETAGAQVIHAAPMGVTRVPVPRASGGASQRPTLFAWRAGLVMLFPLLLVGRAIRSFWFWLLSLLVLIVLLVIYYVIADRDTPLTTDAYVQAYVARIAPQVDGVVVRVHVKEGSAVRKGDILFELDHRPFQHRVAILEAKLVTSRREVKQLKAQLAAEQAEHRRLTAEDDLAKYVYETDNRIFQGGATTERKATTSAQAYKASQAAVQRSTHMVQHIQEAIDARVGQENSLVAQVEAELAEARLNLEYSTVPAPCDGVITNLQLREGDFAHVGEAVLSCVDQSQWMVVANYRERSLERLRTGQTALVTFRGAPGRFYKARVLAIGWGVSQGQGVPSGNLPDVPRLQNWIPPSQRFQVRLVLDDPESAPMRVGTTCTATTIADPSSPIMPLTQLIHRIVALWYYF